MTAGRGAGSVIKKLLGRIGFLFKYLFLGYEKPKEEPYRRASKDNIYDALDFIRKEKVESLNEAVKEKIRNKIVEGIEPVNIGFIVSEGAKWNSGPIMEEIEIEQNLQSRVFLNMNSSLRKLDYETRKKAYLQERDFFLNIDNHLVDLYDWEKDIVKPIEEIDADIIFLQQPWGMLDYPRRMVGRALSAYMHYGFMMMANHGMHYNIGSFHSYLWKYFTQTEGHRMMHLSHDPSAYNKLVVTGYPKLDVYLDDTVKGDCAHWRGPEGKRVIYAPHHGLGNDNLKMSTFKWMHKLMLELAQNTPGLQWIYKPHPNLKYSVEKNNLMSRAQYLQYEKAWSDLPNASVYDRGNYFDIFKTSDALITDCGSFLAEYLPTEKPILWLISKDSVGLNPVGEKLADSFYKIRNVDEFKMVFGDVIIKNNDHLREKRLMAKDQLFPAQGKSATEVVKYIKTYFGIG